jgi:localization factor PodJL
MSASVPWSVNAVDPEAWANARDAARRSGQSVGEWLEAAIHDAASDHGRPVRPTTSPRPSTGAIERRLDELAERLDHFAERVEEAAHAPDRSARSDPAWLDSIEALNERIDGLAHSLQSEDRKAPSEIRNAIQRLDERIEDLVARDQLANANVTPDLEQKLEAISRTIEAMSHRLAQENTEFADPAPPLSPGEELDDAIAEIIMRQSALDGTPPPRVKPRREPAAAPIAAPAPIVVPAPDLSGLERQLKLMADEMQAIRRANDRTDSADTLRDDIGELAEKLGELAPRSSIDALERTVESIATRLDRAGNGRRDEKLTEVAQALHDIRSALAEVRPAESFTSVEKDLHELSSKLDDLGVRGVDNQTVARLQQQTEEIRELLASALPNDVLKALVDQIELLVRKFETGTPNESAILDVLSGVDRRIEALSERVEAAARQMPAASTLDDIRKRLDDLQEAAERGEHEPSSDIENMLRALSQKIDSTEARLGNLGAIERGVADLFTQLQEIRDGVREAAERAAKASGREMPIAAPAVPPAAASPVKQPRSENPPQTVYASLARAANALAAVEVQAEQRAEPVALPRAERIEEAEAETLSGDLPLEPGSGAPRVRLQSAALRVAQSEAVLEGIGVAPDAPARTSDFIAAARRAAQAASAEPSSRAARIAVAPASVRQGVGALLGRGKRALLIAVFAFLAIFVALRYFDGQLPNPFRQGAPAPASATKSATPAKAPQATPTAPTAPTAPAAAPQDRSSHIAPAEDAFAAAPPAGVIGRQDLAFVSQPVPDTTGSTAAANAPAPVQTASAPVNVEMPQAHDGGLPAALGTPALRAAAAAGDPIAAYEIGVRYLEGRGLRADAQEAAIWFEKAAAKGSAPAAYRLGSIYEKGAGGRKNPADARRYYSMAAEAGNIKAMHNLGVMYAEGPDGKPDYPNAARWFRLAAERGVRDSQYNLGVLYARGLGVEQNLTESYRWFALAANQGDGDAGKKRDDIAKRLDVQTLVAAKLAVQTWTATPTDPAANEVQLRPEWEKAETAPTRKRSVKK